MGEVVLRKTQAGLESTRGTQVAATRKVYGKGSMIDKVGIIRPQNEERNSFDATFRSQGGLIEARFPFSGSATFEDLAWWFQQALKGGVTGALRNTAAYDYIFVPTQATDDLKSATWEWGDDTQAWKSGFGMVDKFEVVGALGQGLGFTAEVMVDDWATATFTGALSDRTTEDAIMHLGKIAVGPSGAVPSSYVTGRFIGFKFTINNHLKPKFFADGAGAKYTGMGRQRREFMLEATFEGNAATVTEKANYDAVTARVGRVTISGTNIAGSSPTTAKQIDIVLPGLYTEFQIGERETNSIFTAILEGQYDSVLGYALSATVTNALSSLP